MLTLLLTVTLGGDYVKFPNRMVSSHVDFGCHQHLSAAHFG